MNLKLRQFREASGMTQQQVAKSIKKSFRTVQSWERGESYPNAEMVWDLCVLFGTDPNEFLGWWDEHDRLESPPLTRDEAVLVSDYRECTPDRRRKAAEAVRDQRSLSKGLEEGSASYAGPEAGEGAA